MEKAPETGASEQNLFARLFSGQRPSYFAFFCFGAAFLAGFLVPHFID
jgi:hypothetical protein